MLSTPGWAQGFLQLAATPGFWAICLRGEAETGLHPCKVTLALFKNNKLVETGKLSEGRAQGWGSRGKGRGELPRT